MANIGTASIDMKVATEDLMVAVKIKGVKKFRLRLFVASLLIKLAAQIMPVNVNFEE